MKNIVARIRKLRIEKGYTVEEFSKRIGFSSQTGYHKIESGVTDLKIKHLYRIAEVLEVKPEELLGIDTKSHSNEDTELLKEYIRRMKSDLRTVSSYYNSLFINYKYLVNILVELEKVNPELYNVLQNTLAELQEDKITQSLKDVIARHRENEAKESQINMEIEMPDHSKRLSINETTSDIVRRHNYFKGVVDSIMSDYQLDKDISNIIWGR